MTILDVSQARAADYITRALADSPAFAGVARADLEAFVARAEIARLEPGEVLFRQGDAGRSVYYVVGGRLDVFVLRPDARHERLTELGRGDFTGGMSLLAGRPRAATVRAATQAVLVEMSFGALEALAIEHPGVKAAILEATARRLPMLHLAAMELFKGLDATLFAAFDQTPHWVRLPGGAVLFRQGDPGDSLYIVAHGRLQVVVEHPDGASEVVAHVGRGGCLGEMALLTGDRRFATVRALRDCELIRLSAEEFRRVLTRHPQALLGVTQLLVSRLRDTTAGRRPLSEVSTMAIAPASGEGLHRHVAREIVAALQRQGRRVLHLNRRAIDTQLGAGSADSSSEALLDHRVLQWLGEQEGRYQHVVFECDAASSEWTARCLRQADRVLFVADATAGASPAAHETMLRSGQIGYVETPRELLLVHGDQAKPQDTRRWLDEGRFARHHHVRRESVADYDRVARLVTGRARSLVLGGGGARGFAHLGVLRAFEEAGVPIDIIGGTSMGAVIGAQYASGYGVEAMIDLNRRSFVRSNPIRDYTIPLVSLITGNRMSRVLWRMFGDTTIEDQWLPYFCVATNLSRATVAVHQQGSLQFAVGTSIAVPGLAPPLIHHGDFLVDGGLLENVPVSVMRTVSTGTVFTADVSQRVEFKTNLDPYTHLSGWRVLAERLGLARRREAVPSMFKLLWRSTVLNSVHRSPAVRRASDVYIHPPLDDIEIFDFKAIDRAIAAGYRTAADALTQWKAAA